MPVENNGKIVTLTTESLLMIQGSSAQIYLFGATVTSWKQGGKERLFLSSKSSLDSSKPVSSDGIAEIRGGIPICYPVFGAPPSEPAEYASLPSHGYARSHDWTLDSTVMDRPEGVSVRFKAPAPPAGFDHKHDLHYIVTLTAHQLSTDLHVTNTGTEDFKFQALLHNYLAVPDASKLMVEGLQQGQMWKDKTEGFKEKEWPGGPLKITKEQDGVFAKLPNNDLKLNYGDGTGVNVHFKGFEDCTIWNPQEATGSKMADLEDKGWERYVCIEPGFVSEFKTLKPEERFIGQQVLSTF